MKQAWTKDEITILVEQYPKCGSNIPELDRSISSIQKKANRLGLSLPDDVRVEVNRVAQLKYQDDRPDDSFGVNVTQFLDITQPEVAYLLGLLWADGYIVRTEVRLELISTDLNVLKPLLNSIGEWKYYSRLRNGESNKMTTAVTSNRRLVEFLIEHDYKDKSNVSADKILTKIPDELKHYWFRGFIDGDGFVDKTRVRIIVSGSYCQDWSFVSNLCEELNIKCSNYRKLTNNGDSSSVTFRSNNAIILGDYIYQGEQFGLGRKYKNFLIIRDKYYNSHKVKLTELKNNGEELYKKGIPIIKIVNLIGIPKTTLRRHLKLKKLL